MSSRTTLPLDSAASAGPADLTTAWAEARRAYPIYAALAKQLEISAVPYAEGEALPEEIGPAVVERNLRWFDEMDAQVKAYQIRQLPPATLNAKEEGLRAFIQRHLRKPEKTAADRDKVDFLLVQYFALCAPESFYHDEISLADVIRILQPVVGDANARTPDWCATLEATLEFVKDCRSLRDLLESGKLDQARLVKESSGNLFYDPAALVTLARFNFLMRRAFIRLLHADQEAVLKALGELDRAGVRTVDCRRAGFSAAEPTSNLRQFAENWRPLYHKDYSESAVGRTFEQLLALLADLEDGVAKLHAPVAAEDAPAETPSLTLVPFEPSQPRNDPAEQAEHPHINVEQTGYLRQTGQDSSYKKSAESLAQLGAPVELPAKGSEEKPALDAAPAATPAASDSSAASSPSSVPKASSVAAGDVQPPASADMESCIETIWEQLIATPPTRGRSMSTITLKNTKVLLSSWEVAAFVDKGGQESEDLRRAVVARAMLAVAMDSRKQSGETVSLQAALVQARAEVSYFQGRVEKAKQAKNTEAAVNLGISTKRLLSFIEEADKLSP
ncbi:MAG: hypothetical protein WCB14_06200 [Candidatus Acidiferrales bacterium]